MSALVACIAVPNLNLTQIAINCDNTKMTITQTERSKHIHGTFDSDARIRSTRIGGHVHRNMQYQAHQRLSEQYQISANNSNNSNDHDNSCEYYKESIQNRNTKTHYTSARRQQQVSWQYTNASEVTSARLQTPRSVSSIINHHTAQKIVRVKQRRPKPYSCYEKYVHIHNGERPPDPYISEAEKRQLDENASRKRWVGKAFIVTDHKAAVAQRERASAAGCVTASGPYIGSPLAFRDDDKSKYVGPRGFIV